MSFAFLLSALCGGGFRAGGAEPAAILDVWPDKPPGFQVESGPEKDTSKPRDKGIAGRPVIRLGNVSTPQMHVFLPPKEKRNGTAVVICPGGGFNILAWDLEGLEVAEWLNSIGVAGIVLKYRVPTQKHDPKWLPPVQDAQRAISLVRSKAAEWGIDPDRVGVLGFSAGGEMAARTALQNIQHVYAAVDAVDKVSCRPDFAVVIYPGGMLDENQELKPDIDVTERTPPMFLAQAADDRVRCENSVQLFLALKKEGIPAELHIYDSGGHGFGLRKTRQPCTTWPARCEEWLRLRGFLK